MAKIFSTFLLLMLMITGLHAQTYPVKARHVPLSRLLIQLRGQFQLLTSFDDQLLSHFTLTVDTSFKSKEEMVKGLIDGLPLDYEKENQVFVIFPRAQKRVQPNHPVLLTGSIFDPTSLETLPYSHLLIGEHPYVSDQNGYFSIAVSSGDLPVHIRVSHLGYYVLDTLLTQTKAVRLPLKASSIKLMEVKITGHLIDFNSQLGQQAGLVTLNSQISRHLPGFGDNSVFNLLRLQAGILASGEQTNDMIIWGSYEGQSKVMFDGFTVYGLKNFNDNISAFNPYMAKTVRIMKGGYDASYGGRVGGIIDINGIDGNRNKPSFSLNINNMTVNGLLEVPVGKRASLVAAFRQTYFNLYNPTQYSLKRHDTANQVSTINLDVVPTYNFHDLNLKFSGTTSKNNPYFISLYGGADRFVYNINQPLVVNRLLKETGEENRQAGGSLFYGKNWKKGGSSHFTLSFSHLKNTYSDEVNIQKIRTGQIIKNRRATHAQNQLDELTAKIDHHIPLGRKHQMDFGLVMQLNQSRNREDTFGIVRSKIKMESQRLVVYGQDRINLGNQWQLKAGSRAQYAFNLQKYYFDPRLSLHFTPSPKWKFNLAWGIYHQFIAKSSVLDDEGNYRYVWAVADELDIPVLRSVHHVFEINFSQNNFIFNLQTYYKKIEGLARYMRYRKIVPPGIYHGYGRSYGLDITIKKQYKGSSAWLAYSLGKTEEVFDYYPDGQYRRAPQDQRHELKAALILSFNPVFVSADYVYGSGFPASISQQGRTQADEPYHRVDMALSYRFLSKKIKAEAGLSVMNVFNTQNIKFSNFETIPFDQTNTINIYADAMKRTTSIYLNISL